MGKAVDVDVGYDIELEVAEVIEESEGVRDYEKLMNLPKIENVTLAGNKTFEQLGLKQEAIDLDFSQLFT